MLFKLRDVLNSAFGLSDMIVLGFRSCFLVVEEEDEDFECCSFLSLLIFDSNLSLIESLLLASLLSGVEIYLFWEPTRLCFLEKLLDHSLLDCLWPFKWGA